MVISTPGTYQKETSVSGNSTPIVFIDGQGTFQIAASSSVAATVGISMDGGTTYDPDKDNTSIAADGVYAFDAGADCLARIEVSSGSCTVIGKSKKLY